VVVGGGSSGWIAATTLVNVPGAEVTVIESPNIPKIGVGESTIDGFIDWMQTLGIEPEDMMKDTNSIYKLGIRFEKFTGPDHESYYMFGNPEITKNDYLTWAARRIISPEKHQSLPDTFFPSMALFRTGRFLRNTPMFRHNAFALHFDANKFGPWLWEKYCEPRGVQRIIADVTHIETDENGIKYLELSDGRRVESDLFIDCTGFKSMLLEGALKEPFNDCSDILPNNMAWATHMDYIDKERELEAVTNCTAIENGWVWNIPLWSNIGTGYVYSNKFITDEQALEEFKTHLKKSGRDPEKLEYKKIHMKTGMHKRIWVKNVVAIGLSAGFIEPLESTGLWFTHEFVSKLLRTLSRRSNPTQFDKDCFNDSCNEGFQSTYVFICQHYALSNRRDTEYWKSIANTSFPCDKTFTTASFDGNYHSAWAGIHSIAAGWNHFFSDEVELKKWTYPSWANWKEIHKEVFDKLDERRLAWLKKANTAKPFMSILEEIHSA